MTARHGCAPCWRWKRNRMIGWLVLPVYMGILPYSNAYNRAMQLLVIYSKFECQNCRNIFHHSVVFRCFLWNCHISHKGKCVSKYYILSRLSDSDWSNIRRLPVNDFHSMHPVYVDEHVILGALSFSYAYNYTWPVSIQRCNSSRLLLEQDANICGIHSWI